MSDYKEAFFERYASAAMEQQKRYGIPASVTLAQMALESAYGESGLAKEGNNYFGIKASGSWLREGKPYSVRSDDRPDDKFCTFGSAMESMEYHSKVLMAQRYSQCWQHASDDHLRWIKGIKAGGYATDPAYVSKIEKVIADYGLNKYDRQAISEAKAAGVSIGYMRGSKGGTDSPALSAQSSSQDVGYSMPLSSTLTVTSPFGNRQAPKAGATTDHKGIDLQANGDAVLATEDGGRVLSARNEGNGGNTIRIEHQRADGTRYQTVFMHLKEMNVKEGDTVRARQRIGISGNTGNSTGPHLHFTVYRTDPNGNRQTIDPAEYLADIAVRGNINTRLNYNGADLLANYKDAARERIALEQTQGQQDTVQMLSELTKSNDPKDWLAYLMKSNGDSTSLMNGADPMGSLIAAVFGGLMVMAAQLDKDTCEKEQEANGTSQTETVDTEQVVERQRAATTKQTASVSAASYFEAGMQEAEKETQTVAIK